MGEGDEQSAQDASGFLWEVHKYTNEYIRFADTKAAFIAGASSALIGALVESQVFDSSFKVSLCQWTKLQWAGAVGLILLAVSVGFSLAAIWPRLWNNTPTGFIFWESVTAHADARHFTQAVHRLTDSERSEAVSAHLYVLGRIAGRKYLYVGLALWAGVAGGSIAALVLFTHHAAR